MNKFNQNLTRKPKILSTQEEVIKSVREFQKRYKNLENKDTNIKYTWESNSSSSGELKQKNYSVDSHLI